MRLTNESIWTLAELKGSEVHVNYSHVPPTPLTPLIISNESFLKNTIKNVKPFSDSRFKLGEISLEHDGIKKFFLRKLSESLFHDIPKAINIISGIIESKLSINIESICAITATRHDIVHRNGKNKEGGTLVIDKAEAGRSIMTVEFFAKELRNAL